MKTAEEDARWIRAISPEIFPPSLKDNTADVDRLIKGIKKALQIDNIHMDFSLVKRIPSSLREWGYNVRPVLYKGNDSWRVLDLFPGQMEISIYGLAVDLGSSTVVVRLLDLFDGTIQDEVSFLNPQTEIGPDILTRIHFASQEGGLEKLQLILIDRLNEEIFKVAKRNEIDPQSLVGMSVAGNTTMTHLFLGLDPFWICREPYIPVINSPDPIKAADLGLGINPQSPVLIFPGVGSYFGGDLIAGILASGMNHKDEISILMDVGTNAEVVLGTGEWLMGCAGAAGPALEGGVASIGMVAGPGAVDRLVIDPRSGEFRIRTIENRPPVGICGSGLIDLVAQLFLAGMIDVRGKYVIGRCGERLKKIEGIRHLVVVFSEDSGTGKELTLSQTDIEALIRSKAAMYTILTTITRMINVSMEDINNFYIA
ncbi:MAG: ASKHA domain-containing protein, partial [Thermodesulfobacteriota bacterium]|nr:ASKHA domain-containing protein [Thermodesulfobacteriota bacterium]